jgi:hypothetical protein
MSETLRWEKSSFSGGDEDTDCLEIATALHALLEAVKRRGVA